MRLSTDGGTTYTDVTGPLPAATRSFTIALPNPTAASVQARVRVAAKDAAGSQFSKGESGIFTIQQAVTQPTAVQILSPQGGTFTAGQSLTVQWNTTGPVSFHAVRLSVDGGGTFTDVTPGNLDGAARSFTFTLPAPAVSPGSYVIKVAAKNAAGVQIAQANSAPIQVQAAPPVQTSVQILSPLGGTFTAGQSLTVQWNTTGPVSFHAVQLSTNNGSTFTNVTPNDLDGAARSFSFTLPAPATSPGSYVVKVVAKNTSGVQVAQANSTPIQVQAAPPAQTTVQVVSPSGGTFTAGQSLTVQWTTTGPVSFHAVQLSTNNGSTFANVTPADLNGAARSFAFTLPAPAVSPATCAVRVVAKGANGAQVARADSVPFQLKTAQPSVPGPIEFDLDASSEPQPLALPDTLRVTAGGSVSAKGRFTRKDADGNPLDQTIDAKTKNLPAGAISIFTPNPCQTFQKVDLTIATQVELVPKSYAFQVIGISRTDGASSTPKLIKLVVDPPPTVTLSIQTIRGTISAGGTAEYQVNLKRGKGASSAPVTFDIDRAKLPPGAEVIFEPQTTTDKTARLTIKTDPGAAAKTYAVVVKGNSPGILVLDATASLEVRASAQVIFTAREPVKATVIAGDSAEFKVGVVKKNLVSPVTAVVRPDLSPRIKASIDDPSLESDEITVRVSTTKDASGTYVLTTTIEDPAVEVSPAEDTLVVEGPVSLFIQVEEDPGPVSLGEEPRFVLRLVRTNLPDEVEINVTAPYGESGESLAVDVHFQNPVNDIVQLFVTTDDTRPGTTYSIVVDASREKDPTVNAQIVLDLVILPDGTIAPQAPTPKVPPKGPRRPR